MANYEGAVAAIQQRMRDNWTTSPVAYQNEPPPLDAWPPADQSPWVYFEVLTTKGDIHAVGNPGSQIWLTLGLIHAHIYVAIGSGSAYAQQFARQIGDLFRNQQLYNSEPPNFVRTISPQTDGGGPADDIAGYWRVTCTINFEFYLQA